MIVLGIDTSGASSSAAILTPEGLWSAVSTQPRAHAAVLPGLIQQAAQEAGLPLSRVEAVAVARGPGLFTGMRVGLVTGQVIALARQVPVAGVSSLAAAASRVVRAERPAVEFWVLLDARRREVFAQRFDTAGRPLAEPQVLSAAAAPVGLEVFRDSSLATQGVPGRDLDTRGLAAEVARVAATRWQAGSDTEPATALYLRRPDTTTAGGPRSVLGPT